MEESYLVTIRKAAKLLGFRSVKPVERLIKEGNINTVTVNSRRMVIKSSIVKFINKPNEND